MKSVASSGLGALIGVWLLALMSGCASIPPEQRVPQDPWEGFNRSVYRFNDVLDKAIIKPIAIGYDKVMPEILDQGVTNFFNNLEDPMIAVNQLLQGKPELFVEDGARFVYNSVFGVLGFFDVATRMDLPKHEEDFGQTFGVWGASTGPYLVLPIFGPSNVRDAFGKAADILTDPVFSGRFFEIDSTTRWAMIAVKFIDRRAGLLSAERILEEATLDPYSFIREAFLQRRLSLVYDGNPPVDESMDLFEEGFEDFDIPDEEPSPEAVETAPATGDAAQP